MKNKKDLKVEIEWKKLEDIARYYQFPTAVFLGGNLPKGTRNDNKLKKIIELEKRIKELVSEVIGGD